MKLQQFINQSIKFMPQHKEFLNWFAKDPLLIRMLQDIQIKNSNLEKYQSNENFGLFAKQDIPAQQDILLVSAQKCITGLELVGSDRSQSFSINNVVQRVASKYYQDNLNQLYYTQNVLKIMVQIFVHNQDSSMTLNPYAKFLTSREHQTPMYWEKKTLAGIYDSHLASLIASTKNQYEQMYQDLQQEKLFGIDFQFFIQLLSIVRSRTLNFVPEDPKYFDLNSVAILCPIIDLANHNFKNNCKIEGRYHQHESDSYVVLRSVKDIKKGEELTLNYGNYHNYDFLMRYGFGNQNNKFNEMPIALDFNDYLEFTGQLFEFKQKLFRSIPDFSLDKLIIYQNKINQELIAILRIYFITESDLQNNRQIASYTFKDFKKQISLENETNLCKFMIDALQQELDKCSKIKRNTLDINMLKKANGEIIDLDSLKEIEQIENIHYKNMLQISLEQEIMLKNNQQFFKKKLAELN